MAGLTAVSFLPHEIKRLAWTEGSLHYAGHVAAFLITGLLMIASVRAFSGRIAGIALLFLFGAALELGQSLYYSIVFEWKDLVCDCLGLGLAGLTKMALRLGPSRMGHIGNQSGRYRKSMVALTILAFGASWGAQAAPADPQRSSCAPPTDYILGPGDQLSILIVNLETDFTDRTFTIGGTGDITLPELGRVHAAGLTTSALEAELRGRAARVVKDPQAVVSVATYRNQPVSVLGAVNNPGMRQIEVSRSLFDVLSLAGGLRPDAGYLIHIARPVACGPIPLPDALMGAQTSTASVRVKDILEGSHPEENISIYPGDEISIPKAAVVYAVGSVNKPGGFLLNDNETLSALQVLSLSEGLQKTAAGGKARILRTVPGSANRTEIAVNLKLLLSGKGSDVPLQPGDILFVPNNNAKSIGLRTVDVVSGLAGAALLYTR